MSFPLAKIHRLPDGRLLEYAEYGDPKGTPCVFFHGFIGSYHQAAFAHTAAERYGVRLFALNRPGVGRSSVRERRTIVEFAEDVRDFCDVLHLGKIIAIGASGGAPYALACLAAMPEQVAGVVLLSGLGPVGDQAVLLKMNHLARRVLQVGRRIPWLIRLAFDWRAKLYRRDPEAFLDELVNRWSHSDRTLFKDAEVRRYFMADIRQVLVDGEGGENLARELGLYFRWGFRLTDLPLGSRVHLWHGREDRLVPCAMSEFTAKQLRGAELILRPGGHFMAVTHAEEIMARALEFTR